MLLAVLTDIHANREALEACLEHARARGAQAYAVLGDIVGYGADPAWVVDRVRELTAPQGWCVLGNHDAAMIQPPRKQLRPEALQVLQWTRQQLSDAQLEFIRGLPMHIEFEDLLFVHANAWAPAQWEYIDGVMEAGRSLRATRATITFCGHMHDPMLYNMDTDGRVLDFAPPPDAPVPLGKRRRWLAIPGSAGQPRDGNPAACYALYDDARRVLTYHRVPYDAATAARKVRDAGLPPRLGDRLESGW
jgi:diadenosine tetraphosphatase ApaH/serine/threonine PP2A family protein phosphatase